MPHVDSVFSNEYLDEALSKMRDCLRDMKTATDRPHMLAIRERCKERMRRAAAIFTELREAYDDKCAESQRLAEEIADAEPWEERYRRLTQDVIDLQRGLIDAAELRRLAIDYAEGNRKVTT